MKLVYGVASLIAAVKAIDEPQTFFAPELYGNVACREPDHRFENPLREKLPHNQDMLDQNKEWICQFCNDDLMKVVERVCCGETGRKKRETDLENFWSGKSMSPNNNFNNYAALHPDNIIKQHIETDCLSDLREKHRVKRGAWDRTKRIIGKARSTFADKLDEITCKHSVSADFLGFKGKTPNGGKYKHTFIQQECCGFGGNPQDGGCDNSEVMNSYLGEECCGEGCRYREILEDCGAWRWDLREQFEKSIL